MSYWVNFFVLQWLCIAGIRILGLRLFQGRYKGAITQFMGSRLPMLGKKGTKKRIWIHAPSLGEVKSLQTFLEILRAEEPEASIVFSVMTETAQDYIKKHYPFAESAFYLPCDLSWIMRRWMAYIQPDLLIIMESGFWYNLLRCAKEQGVKVAVLSGRMSPLSYKRYRRCKTFSASLFSYIDHFCLQGKKDSQRFQNLGVPAHKITLTGNLKYDTRTILSPQLEIPFSTEDYIVTVASTHAREEQLLLDALRDVKRSIKILLAPRYPERVGQIEKLLKCRNYRFCRLTDRPTGKEDIILIDQMGQLEACFSISHAAIMGGSFVKHVGGHNLLEAARYGIPVIYGPFMERQAEIVSLFKKHDYGKQVALNQICGTLERYLGDTAHKEKTKRLIKEIQGVSQQSWEKIKMLQ